MTRYIRISILAAAALSTLSLSACASRRQQVQGVMPDEFRIVARQPLIVPPEFALRPPVPGKPRPQELQPESAARAALLGASSVADRNASQGERLLLAHAGADASTGNIKAVIDDEYGDIAYKSPGFADKVLFWRKDAQVASATAAAQAPSAVDPAVEAKRLNDLTGGKVVTISKNSAPEVAKKRRFKLPGL